MRTQTTNIDDRIAVETKLSEAMHTEKNLLYLDEQEIVIEDIQQDYRSFCEQAQFYVKNGLLWPCIALDRVDFRDNSNRGGAFARSPGPYAGY